MSFPLPAGELAGLIAPLQLGEGSGLLDRAVWQDVPAPPPSQPLLEAGFKVGTSVATGEWVGVDPDGHGLATGGSRTGKSSFTYAMLKQLIARGEDAPGIFLVDPHLSLADAFLDLVAQLPEGEREKAYNACASSPRTVPGWCLSTCWPCRTSPGPAMPLCRSGGAFGTTTGDRVCRLRCWDSFAWRMSGTCPIPVMVWDFCMWSSWPSTKPGATRRWPNCHQESVWVRWRWMPCWGRVGRKASGASAG